MRENRSRFAWVFAGFLLVTSGGIGAQEASSELRNKLELLQADGQWGEVVLADGRLRSIHVESVGADSAHVQEIYGALQRRSAVYALGDMRSVRVLGDYRIQTRSAAVSANKSMLSALALEAVVPGVGYMYIGEMRQALALWGLTGIAVGTAIATGEDGAAGWAPLSAWIKFASLYQLRDKVRAMNDRSVVWDVEAGAMAGDRGPVPSLGVRVAF